MKRVFVALIVLLAVPGLMLMAGGKTESTSGAGTATGGQAAAAGKFNESPMLKELVAQGKLPTVDKRLPDVPFVVGPDILCPKEYLDFTVGKYGGTLRLAHITWVNEALFCLEPVLRPNNPIGSKGARPAIVSDFQVSPDNKTFTFTIRKGIRWSDGNALTTEDVRFLFEDVYSNPEAKYGWPANLRTLGRPEGAPPKWTIKDQYTFSLAYDQPYGYLVAGLSSWIWGYRVVFQPAEYLKQFHSKFTSVDKLKPLFKENMKEWGDLFSTKILSIWDFVVNPACLGQPVLTAFYPKEMTQDYILWERNPYFWMVDTAGNQLPYFDSVQSTKMNDMEAVKMRVLSGNVDFALYPALSEVALYAANKDKGNFSILECATINNAAMLVLNQDFEYDVPNSAYQKIIGDDKKRKDFGTALALAIDKDDVNKAVYFGRNGLPTTTPAEYNPTKAKQLLDGIGMNKLDSEGFRLAPDGQRFELTITQSIFGGDPQLIPVAELLKGYFDKVGVRTTLKTIQEQLWNQLAPANKIMAVIIWADEPMWPGGISRDYQPNAKGMWGYQSWLYWNSGGKSGRTPPAYMQQFWDLDMARNQYAPGSPEGEAAYKKLMQWYSDNFAYVFPTQRMSAIRIYSNRLGNVPKNNMPFDRVDYMITQLYIK